MMFNVRIKIDMRNGGIMQRDLTFAVLPPEGSFLDIGHGAFEGELAVAMVVVHPVPPTATVPLAATVWLETPHADHCTGEEQARLRAQGWM